MLSKGDGGLSSLEGGGDTAAMAAELLRANVRLEAERDRAQDDVDQLTTQLKEL